MEEGSKELIVECVDDGFKGFVETLASHTLHALRQLLADEFDDDMLPTEYYFSCDNIRYSSKQESKKKLWDLIDRDVAVRIHDKGKGQKRQVLSSSALVDESNSSGVANKKLRTTNDGEETPTQDASAVDASALAASPVAASGVVQEVAKATRISSTPTSFISHAKLSPAPDADKTISSALEAATFDVGTNFSSSNDEETESQSIHANVAAKSLSSTTRGANEAERDPAGAHSIENTPVISNKSSDVAKEGHSALSAVKKAILFSSEPRLPLSSNDESPPRLDAGMTQSASAGRIENTSTLNVTEATQDEAETNVAMSRPPPSTVVTGASSSSLSSSPSNITDQANDSAASDGSNSVEGSSPRIAPKPPSPSPSPSTCSLPVSSSTVDNANEDDFGGGGDDDNDEGDGGDDDDVVSLGTIASPLDDANAVQQEARDKSIQVLNDLQALLKDNPLFCSEERKEDLNEEIRERLASTAPRVVVGVLGSTGVGKSSLLNALLDEAAVLPTSGSRGCTAAVVELSFNQDLADPPASAETISVYRGRVEFIKPQDWEAELRVLVDECSTHEKHVYVRRPEPESAPDAHAAWEKIDQVYGRGTMDSYKSQPTATVLRSLLNNRRVNSILAPKDGQEYNSIVVEEGSVDASEASLLLGGFDKLSRRMRRSVKGWAHAFRRKINDYVYRKGNGSDPQTWPLIRCVTLQGPWNVLATGACLVDLPGVRDANAARARVSERYLQNCNQIWVVAPIKRAVDDGTAKELLGEQFKRRLLMDGQYGNVSFICTQTDDCEATEIMRDHPDVAQSKPGRWERMTGHLDKIAAVDTVLSELLQEEEDLQAEYDEAIGYLDDVRGAEDTIDADDEDRELRGNEERDSLLGDASDRVAKALLAMKTWRNTNAPRRERLHQKSHKLQLQLKSLCAQVRNEYSTRCLKDDFVNGLKDLYRNEDGETQSGKNVSLPDDLDLNVFCISANDYLKVQGIKPTSDGPPNCFSTAHDTQIPSLRTFVRDTTATHRKSFFEMFANQVSDIVDRFKLIATEADNGGSTRVSRKCLATFETEMQSLERKVKVIVDKFRSTAGGGVASTLRPSLKAGAKKGHSSALETVHSWGSTSRRTKTERRPDKNGLCWSTYQATIRRSGVYASACAGSIDFNQELCDPMEKEFSPAWQSIMDGSLRLQIADCETKIQALCGDIDRALAKGFSECGMDRSRLGSLATAASRNCSTALKASFQAIRQVASDSQRDLNRSLLPKIQERMSVGYTAAAAVPGGTGKFVRMKTAVHGHASSSVHGMFDESIADLLNSIRQLIDRIATMISASVGVVRKALEGVYALCWEGQSEKAASKDPAQMQQIRACRDDLLPELGRLRTVQDSAMYLLGIERDELELDILQVDTWEQRQARLLQQAIDKGELIDLCDSSDEEEDSSKAAANSKPKANPTANVRATPGKVKAETTSFGTPAQPSVAPPGPALPSVAPPPSVQRPFQPFAPMHAQPTAQYPAAYPFWAPQWGPGYPNI